MCVWGGGGGFCLISVLFCSDLLFYKHDVTVRPILALSNLFPI